MDYKITAKELNNSLELNKVYKSQELLSIIQNTFHFGRCYTSYFLSEMKKDHTVCKESNGYKIAFLPIYYGKIVKWHQNIKKSHIKEDSYRNLLKLQKKINIKIQNYESILVEVKKDLISLGFTSDVIDTFLNE